MDLDLQPGEITMLAGPSGAGKSRLLRVLADLEQPADGRILLQGTPLTDYPAPAYRRAVGYQLPTPLLGTDSVGALLERVAQLHERTHPEPLTETLARVGLSSALAQRSAAELSTGEALRVALALLLSGRPQVLLLDEPTGPLDPGTTTLVEELIRERAHAGAAVLWASHDPAQAGRMGDGLLYLENGRLHGPERDTGQFEAIMERLQHPTETNRHAD